MFVATFRTITKTLKAARSNFNKYRVLCKNASTSGSSYVDDDFDLAKIDENQREYEEIVTRCFGINQDHKCFIIHPYAKWGHQKVRDTNPQQRLEEAVALVRTLDPWKVAGHQIVALHNLQKKLLFGKGNLEKLKNQIRGDPQITAVFINTGTLKNMQMDELEKIFGVPIFDRYKIVMQILRMHATSKHAKLQIALAEIPYLWKRLRFDDNSLSPSGDKDTRKLILHSREQKVKQAIDKLRSQRQLLRKKRTQIDFPVVAVVGYTNSGKTSLIKALTGEESLKPRNQLFATLDVTMHSGKLPSNLEVLYVDTVGFISDIPTTLIECFIATLEDALLADVIVHVEDLANDSLVHQRNNVLATLQSLAKRTETTDLLDKIISVGNKVDVADPVVVKDNDNRIAVSCTKLKGIDELKHEIESRVVEATDRIKMKIRIPIGGDEIRWLYKNAAIVGTDEDPNDGQQQIVQLLITKAKLSQFKHHFISMKS